MSCDFNTKLYGYYDKKFPSTLIYNWLSYNDPNNFKLREFSYTLPGDIYVRYQAFNEARDFRTALRQKTPIKIDVGAIYNKSPRQARIDPTSFKPVQHELVFDIDISDYDDVRNCCSESNICNKCWPFMRIGAKILHTVLTQEFGFKQLLFVFSGRRGFHCWVCDEKARFLQTDARKAIADYFSVVVGGQAMVKRVTLNPQLGIHPMLRKALSVIDTEFEDLMIEKQDFLSNEHLVQNIIDLVGDDTLLKQRLKERCKGTRLSSADCWKIMIFEAERKTANRRSRHNYFIQEVKLQHCFPRLDANVTRGFNHLLKLPFCIHPKTGNVCVPIDFENIDSFDIDKVPNLSSLTDESLDPYLKVMKKFVESI